MTTNKLDLPAIKARLEAATEGPWHENFSVSDGAEIVAADSAVCCIREGCTERGFANMTFIAHARTDIPALCAEVEQLRLLLGMANCPNCDGSGSIPHQVADQEWEAEQCQWCYETKIALEQE